MPPRFNYWTILIDDAPTAFRAAQREELLPTLAQLQRTHKNAALKWFAQGRLWESEDEQRDALRREREQGRRPKGWRPGGDHRDPRERYQSPNRRQKWKERFFAKQREALKKPEPADPSADVKRDGPPRPRKPWGTQPPVGGGAQRPPQQRPPFDKGPRERRDAPNPGARKTWQDRDKPAPRGDRPGRGGDWRDSRPDRPRGPREDTPRRPPVDKPRDWRDKPSAEGRKTWQDRDKPAPRGDRPGRSGDGRDSRPDRPRGPREDAPRRPPVDKPRDWRDKPSAEGRKTWQDRDKPAPRGDRPGRSGDWKGSRPDRPRGPREDKPRGEKPPFGAPRQGDRGDRPGPPTGFKKDWRGGGQAPRGRGDRAEGARGDARPDRPRDPRDKRSDSRPKPPDAKPWPKGGGAQRRHTERGGPPGASSRNRPPDAPGRPRPPFRPRGPEGRKGPKR